MQIESFTHAELVAALEWQLECGADEAIGEVPANRFETAGNPAPRQTPRRTAAAPAPAAAPPRPAASGPAEVAAACADLAALKAAMTEFEGLAALRTGARSTVFADGNPAARLMVIGEAPGREEDRAGLPFIGRSGQLLDRMLAAIGLSRQAEDPAAAVYITNTLPWRPPGNREPSADEVAAMLPFLHRHIELVAPEVLLLVGSSAVRTMLQTSDGITRRRGKWTEIAGLPVIATWHPAALLRDPIRKREAWADLLMLKERLDG
ncbi:DNA polymerase [Amaricoccus macauensis]|uniref:Type-4 uracil-DNA glycosylase n=1 Tax=Amaricoccus macauensis TaxID=57001 RepID=A0A840SSR8_9RHOB|nr:uracil-DNA glycosylase [Amaricoccus macauensis]MBB5223648.1 DNA polymerase [Amaricoccus macauensis]